MKFTKEQQIQLQYAEEDQVNVDLIRHNEIGSSIMEACRILMCDDIDPSWIVNTVLLLHHQDVYFDEETVAEAAFSVFEDDDKRSILLKQDQKELQNFLLWEADDDDFYPLGLILEMVSKGIDPKELIDYFVTHKHVVTNNLFFNYALEFRAEMLKNKINDDSSISMLDRIMDGSMDPCFMISYLDVKSNSRRIFIGMYQRYEDCSQKYFDIGTNESVVEEFLFSNATYQQQRNFTEIADPDMSELQLECCIEFAKSRLFNCQRIKKIFSDKIRFISKVCIEEVMLSIIDIIDPTPLLLSNPKSSKNAEHLLEIMHDIAGVNDTCNYMNEEEYIIEDECKKEDLNEIKSILEKGGVPYRVSL